MANGRYILGPGHVAIPEPDLLAWGQWMQTADRVVARTELADGAIEVSTVFLGLDHSHGEGARRLFETLVFYNGPRDEPGRTGALDRYPTWAMAETGHARMVEQLRAEHRAGAGGSQ